MHNGSAAGPVVYRETHSATTNTLGLFTVNIGQGSASLGTFPSIDWGGGSKFIQVEMDPAGGISYTDMGTQQMLSVPYALNAENGNWNKNGNDIYNSNTGNVGIGTTTPSAILHIAAAATKDELVIGENLWNVNDAVNRIQLGNSSNSAFLRIGQLASNFASLGWVYNATPADAYVSILAHQGANPLVLQRDGGNVGIGTITPVNKLNIIGANGDPLIPGSTSNGIMRIGVSANEGIDIGKMASSPYSGWIQAGLNSIITDPLSLQPLGGDVGIGTSSPSTKLDINKTAAFNTTTPGFSYYNLHLSAPQNSVNDQATGITFGTTKNVQPQAGIYVQNSSAYGTKMYFGTTNSYITGSQTRMTIDNTGNVGVGTTLPGAKLEVAPASFTAAAQSRTALRLNAGSFGSFTNNALNMEFGNAGTAVIGAEVPSSGGMYDLVFSNFSSSTNFTEKVRITGSGNVGIGCTLPQYKLHVIGDIASSGTVRTTNTLVTGAITACSDIRFKKQITPLQNSLENILQLQGVNYFWKTKEFPDRYFNEINQIGLIAQEVEKIFPELVVTNIDGYKSVDYSKLTPILVEAIKELKAENSSVKSSLVEMQNKIQSLESKINLLTKEPLAGFNK